MVLIISIEDYMLEKKVTGCNIMCTLIVILISMCLELAAIFNFASATVNMSEKNKQDSVFRKDVISLICRVWSMLPARQPQN